MPSVADERPLTFVVCQSHPSNKLKIQLRNLQLQVIVILVDVEGRDDLIYTQRWRLVKWDLHKLPVPTWFSL